MDWRLMDKMAYNFEDKAFREWIKTLPCACCGYVGYEDERGVKQYMIPHHQTKEHDSIMGGKVSDRRCVPLCAPHWEGKELKRGCHDRYHANPGTFWKRDIEELIKRLNFIYDTYINKEER